MSEKSGISSRKLPYRLTRKFYAWVVFGTAGCILISALFSYVLFSGYSLDVVLRGYLMATALPIVLAVPLLSYLGIKVIQLHGLNKRLTVMAQTDTMTGLWNREAFSNRVNGWLGNPSGAAADRVAVFVVDADNFKQINDRYGHHAGDKALLAITSCLVSGIREEDLAGRLGGEEFGVAVRGTGIEEVLYIADRIRRGVAHIDFRPNGCRHDLSVSIGVSISAGTESFEDLLRDADNRLYEAKTAGRNTVKVGVPGFPSFSVSGDIVRLLNDEDLAAGDERQGRQSRMAV